MKIRLILIFAIILSTDNIISQIVNNKIIIGTIDSLDSKILNEERKILVHIPNSYYSDLFKNQKYPVVYLLDGESHFTSVVGLIDQLSQLNANTICPDMIVVGICNTNRTRDLTPTTDKKAPFMDSAQAALTGGGEKFTLFLEKELIPYINTHYPTAPYKMLIGHSLGGLMAINTLIKHSELFNSYVAIDPSIWWNNQSLFKESVITLKQKKINDKSFFLAMANTLNKGMDTLMLRKDTSISMNHPRSILQYADIVKNNSNSSFKWNWKYYKDDDHGSVPLIAEYDALRFIFDFHKLPPFYDILDNYDKPDSVISKHYENVTKQMGYTIYPPEPIIEQLGYICLSEKKYDKCYGFFKMNITNYPKNFNGYDSMADYYDAIGNNKKAIEYYEKALSITDFPETRRKYELVKTKK